jgi:hypothetical protein
MSTRTRQSPQLVRLLVGGVVTLWVAVAVQVAAEWVAK